MPKPVCVKCSLEMRVAENGVALVEMSIGLVHAVWLADLWCCADCGAGVIAGRGESPVARGMSASLNWLCDHEGIRIVTAYATARERDTDNAPAEGN